MALIVKIFGKNKLSGTLDKIGSGVFSLGKKFTKFGLLAATAIGTISVKLAADMGKGLREIGTLMGGLTDGEMKTMGRELQSLAASSGQAMDKLTKARYDIVSAGFADAANSALLLKTSADLAVGGVSDISTAADLLTTTLNAYNMEASKSVDVSDKLFTIVKLGKTTITELGGSMGNVLALAGQLGVDLDEVGAVLATLTAGGINTAESVTSLNATMTQILKPTEDLASVINDLGFENGSTMIKSLGLAKSIRKIQEHAEKTNTPMTDLFSNVRAMKAILPLTGTAAETFADNLATMGESAGATAGAVSEMEKSFSLDMSKLKQNVNNVLTTIGNALIKKLQPKIKEANEILSELGDIGWDTVAGRMVSNTDLLVKILQGFLNIIELKVKKLGLNIREEMPWILGGTSDEEELKANLARLDSEIDRQLQFIEARFKQFATAISEPVVIAPPTKPKEGENDSKEVGVTLDDLAPPDLENGLQLGLVDPMNNAMKKIKKSNEAIVLTEDQKITAFKAAGDAALSLASINKSASEQNFKIWQAAATAQAIVDTYAGANAAFKSMAGIPGVGVALGTAAAVAAVAAGLARVSVIRSQKFQLGGRPPLGQPSIVGEGGRELFVPDTPGTIIPNDRTENLLGGGSGITVNIQAIDAQGIADAFEREPEAFSEGINRLAERRF